MKTSEPILTRGRDNWDKVNMPVAAFHERMGRVRAAMDDADVDALFVYGGGDRDGDLAYVSNLIHKVPGFPIALVVTGDDVVVVNQRSSRTRPIVERSTWTDDVRFTRNLWGDLDGILTDVTDRDARVAVVGGDVMSQATRERVDELAESWSVEVRDDLLAGVRAVKDDRERDQVRRSARILRAVDDVLAESVHAPIEERDLYADVDRIARLHGAQDVRLLVSNPAHTEAALRPAEEVPIQAGDRISLYLAVRYENYWSSMSRTTTLDGEEVADLEAVEGVLADLVDSLEPGADAAAAVREARSAVSDLGLDLDPHTPVLSGIGLELDESPVVGADDGDASVPVEAGNCFEVSFPVEGDDGPLLVGETVVVTGDGPEAVTAARDE